MADLNAAPHARDAFEGTVGDLWAQKQAIEAIRGSSSFANIAVTPEGTSNIVFDGSTPDGQVTQR